METHQNFDCDIIGTIKKILMRRIQRYQKTSPMITRICYICCSKMTGGSLFFGSKYNPLKSLLLTFIWVIGATMLNVTFLNRYIYKLCYFIIFLKNILFYFLKKNMLVFFYKKNHHLWILKKISTVN